MSLEATKIQIPEQRQKAGAEFADVFNSAFSEAQRDVLYRLTGDAEFHAFCLEHSIDPNNDYEKGEYWNAVADYAYDRVAAMHSRGGESIRLSAFELLADTPAFIFASKNIEHFNDKEAKGRVLSPADMKQKLLDKKAVSYFNGLVRNFATDHPTTHASSLALVLSTFANKTILNPDDLQKGIGYIDSCIHGAQHELAFGQILAHTGRKFRTTSLDEDLRGADYIISDGRGGEIPIDVKASMSKMVKQGVEQRPYTRNGHGELVIFSLVRETELNDRFGIPDELAERKAAVLNQLLDEAQNLTVV